MSFQGSIVLHLLLLAPVWCQVENYADTIPGVAGQDYPIFAFPPATSFVCDGRSRGYYSDPEADCQAFTICAENGEDGGVGLLKFSFLAPTGLCLTKKASSVTGGLMWIVLLLNSFMDSINRCLQMKKKISEKVKALL